MGHFSAYRIQVTPGRLWACLILMLLKFWTNRFFGCFCGGPRQRRVSPSKTSRIQVCVFSPTGKKLQKPSFAGLFPHFSILVVSFPFHSPLPATCPWLSFPVCTAEKPWSNFDKDHGNFPAFCPQGDAMTKCI